MKFYFFAFPLLASLNLAACATPSQQARQPVFAALLADDIILITGTDRTLFTGREAQLAIWRGAATGDSANTVSGAYSAKWPNTGGQWFIEAETYATTTCTGALSPASTPKSSQ